MSQPEHPSNDNSLNTPKRPLLGRRRLSYLPIVLLVLVAFAVLAFVTFRQLRSARDHRLRLLAGFGDRVELTVPQLAGRFSRIIQENDELDAIKGYIRIVPNLQLVGEPQEIVAESQSSPSGPTDEDRKKAADRLCAALIKGGRERIGASAPCLVLASRNEQIDLVYVGIPGAGVPVEDQPKLLTETGMSQETAVADSPDDPQNGADSNDAESGEILARPADAQIELNVAEDAENKTAAVKLTGPHVFYGRITLRQLLQEILIPDVFDSILVASTKTGRVLHQEGEPALVVSDLRSLLDRSPSGLTFEKHGPATAIIDVTLDPKNHRWLDQGNYKLFLQPISLHSGLPEGVNIAAEEWVAGGLITDERLLAAGFSTSPVILFLLIVSFPAALIFWPFLKLWLISPRQSMTRFDIVALVASSLLGLTLATLLIFDLLFLSRLNQNTDVQLKLSAEAMNQSLTDELESARRQLSRFVKSDLEKTAIPVKTSFADVIKLVNVEIGKNGSPLNNPDYPYFHSIFWANQQGEQISKLPLRPYAVFTSQVRARQYFQCALHGTGYSFRDKSICIEPIFSNTTGQDLVAIAQGSGSEVAVLTTVLLSLREPVLAPGFGFAVLDETGRALFHADPRRNMTEDFLKASDEDSLLSALLGSRRSGHLTVNYWGARHRLYVLPIEGLPWTLVTYRTWTDLRLRNFEVIYDFLVGAGPYFLFVSVVLAYLAMRRRVLILWPTSSGTGLYRFVVLVVVFLTGLFSLTVALASPAYLYWASLLIPAVAVGSAGIGFHWRTQLENAFERSSEEKNSSGERVESTKLAFYVEIVTFSLLLALAAIGFFLNKGFVNGFLLVAAVCAAVAWPWLRAYFLAMQRRRSFIAALTAMLFAIAVLPATGLFQLASSRQLQYLVQESQAGLAHSLEQREKKINAIRAEIGIDNGFFGGYEQRLAEWKDCTLLAHFGTWQAKDPTNWTDPPRGQLWPVTRGESPPLHIALLSARPAPPSQIASSRLGLDLSRFESSPHQWRSVRIARPKRCSTPEGSLSFQIIGRFKEPWETGKEIDLISTPFSRSAHSIPPLRAFFVTIALLGLVVMPCGVARFLADRVLLARLARSKRHRATLPQILVNWGDRHVSLRRVLLITGVPALALREAKVSKKYCLYDLGGQVPPKESTSGMPVLLTGFAPTFENEVKLDEEVRRLETFLAEHERDEIEKGAAPSAVVLLTQASYSHLIRKREASTELFDLPASSPHRRLINLLAPFTVYFGHDLDISDDDRSGAYKKAFHRKRTPPGRRTPWSLLRRLGLYRFLIWSVSENRIYKRRRQKLFDILYSEGRPTRQLQRIALRLLRIPEEDSCTPEQIVSHFGLATGPYYEAIWTSCSVDERIVLAQLAWEGVANPKAYETILDLLHKGLVRRDPVLRLMNRSFESFVRRALRRWQLVELEESGASAWSVFKWLLPLPLLLLGGFLFLTQQDAVSNVVGLVIALASLVPTFINFYQQFQQFSAQKGNRGS